MNQLVSLANYVGCVYTPTTAGTDPEVFLVLFGKNVVSVGRVNTIAYTQFSTAKIMN